MWCKFAFGFLGLAAFALAVPACKDECREGAAKCKGTLAMNCLTEVSDGHSLENPYVWHERDCSEMIPYAPWECRVKDHRAECVVEVPMPEVEEDKAYVWNTPTVAFGADTFTITAGGQSFDPGQKEVVVESAINREEVFWSHQLYTSLDLSWYEHNRQMRFSLEFEADDESWWVEDLRTYGVDTEEWIEYGGPHFKTALGEWYSGNLQLSTTDPPGTIKIEGLLLRAFW